MTMDSWPGDPVFCSQCGARLEPTEVRNGDVHPVCPACGYIAYRSPSIGVAVLLRDVDGRVLLVQRGNGATRAGYWSIPAGYMDYGEEVRAAAARELLEETGLEVEVGDAIFVATNTHDPAKRTVGIWFDGEVVGGVLHAGDDAVDAGWYPLDALPPLAFETDAALFDRLRRGG
jgi:8-oxo-dGTP diphosphatase